MNTSTAVLSALAIKICEVVGTNEILSSIEFVQTPTYSLLRGSNGFVDIKLTFIYNDTGRWNPDIWRLQVGKDIEEFDAGLSTDILIAAMTAFILTPKPMSYESVEEAES